MYADDFYTYGSINIRMSEDVSHTDPRKDEITDQYREIVEKVRIPLSIIIVLLVVYFIISSLVTVALILLVVIILINFAPRILESMGINYRVRGMD